ncbi:hypothetical protein OFEAOIEE_LOCUS3255 [Methylorubrum extorquens]
MGELGTAFCCRGGCREVALESLLVVTLSRQPLQAAVDHVQEVVEVMGQASRELTDGFHLLGLPELLL